MSVELLKSTREAFRLSQADMATQMGLGLTAYKDIESGFSKFKTRHMALLERASLRLACERRNLDLALPSIRRDAVDYARLFDEGNPGTRGVG